MPAFRGRVSEDQVQDLIAYVRAFGPAPASEAAPGDFEEKFRQLQEQWNSLQKQLQEITPKAQQP